MKTTKKTVFPLVCISFILNGLYLTTLGKTLAQISADYGLNSTQMGLIMTVQFIMTIIVAVPLGRLGDKIGKKKIYFLQSGAYLAGMFCIAAAQSIGLVLAGVLLGGMGYGLMGFIASSVIADTYPDKASKYMILSNVVFSVGAISAPFLVDAMIAGGLNWRVPYLIAGILGVGAFLLLLFTRIEKVAAEDVHSEGELTTGQLLKNPLLILLGVSMFVYMGIEQATSSFVDSFYQEAMNAPQYSAIALSVMWLMMVPSRLIISFKKGKRYPIIITSFVLSIVSGIVITLVKDPIINIVAFGVLGFAFGPVWPFLLSMASRAFYANSGMAGGMISMFSGIGGAVLPPIFGLVASNFGYPYIFIVVSAFSVIGVLAYGSAVKIVKKKDLTEVL